MYKFDAIDNEPVHAISPINEADATDDACNSPAMLSDPPMEVSSPTLSSPDRTLSLPTHNPPLTVTASPKDSDDAMAIAPSSVAPDPPTTGAWTLQDPHTAALPATLSSDPRDDMPATDSRFMPPMSPVTDTVLLRTADPLADKAVPTVTFDPVEIVLPTIEPCVLSVAPIASPAVAVTHPPKTVGDETEGTDSSVARRPLFTDNELPNRAKEPIDRLDKPAIFPITVREDPITADVSANTLSATWKAPSI